MKTILIVGAHADDETLGCGGVIARHVAHGDSVHLVVMADGVMARSTVSPGDLNRRSDAMIKAAEILGIRSTRCCGFPDNKMDSVPLLDLVREIEVLIHEISPSVVYTHHHGDLNIDHRRTYEAVMTACRPLPGCSVREIYGFEVLSSTEWSPLGKEPFTPAMFVDIFDYLPKKLCALEAYAEEIRSVPHSRSVKHAEVLALHRGYTAGLRAAEAFSVYRLIKGEG